MITVSNSSPLISLSAIDLLDLLPALYKTIYITDAVYDEVVIKGSGRAGAQRIASAAWISCHTLTDPQTAIGFRNQTKLQQGEAEAILLALELGATSIILDDAPARQVAFALSLVVTGTVGVLLAAKNNQLLSSVKRAMDDLMMAGAYIHPDLYSEVLRRAGE
ncbi:MAG: hypothetical protein V7641_346 [Blastocatellia bacterium]